MSLRDWQRNSWLVEHKTSAQEIAALLAIVERHDRFRKKRNIIGYESAGVVSEREAREMHELATGLRGDVLAWLRKRHPKLLKQ